MHQAFTGSTRKSRSVNLSGRPATNPWANLPGSAKSGTQPGASTLAQAQAERQRRQRDRDNLNASKKVQKTWRGHNHRRTQKAIWRQQWDDNERSRLGDAFDSSYEQVLDAQFTVPAYNTAEQLQNQLRLLNHIQEYRKHVVRHEMDTARVLYFGNALQASKQLLSNIDLDQRWKHNLSRYGFTIAKHVRSIKNLPASAKTEEALRQLCTLISFLVNLLPTEMTDNPSDFILRLGDMVGARDGTLLQDAVVSATIAILHHGSQSAYRGFIHSFLSTHHLSMNAGMMKKLGSQLDLRKLAQALQDSDDKSHHREYESLWELSYLVYMHRSRPQVDVNTTLDVIKASSTLLGLAAPAIRDGFGSRLEGQEVGPGANPTIPTFMFENVSVLHQKDFVQQAIAILSQNANNQSNAKNDFGIADELAKYALSIMSAFEREKASTRQILYQSSIKLSSGETEPTISYFWSIVGKTRVFQKIANDDKMVISILTEAAPEENQFARPATTQEQVQQWKAEWRIILTFLELYNFALQLMDDEDFFSTSRPELAAPLTSQFRKGALPLAEVAVLIIFLKHLAFALYWHAGSLLHSDEGEDPERLAFLLGSNKGEKRISVQEAAPVKLAGNDISHGYLKELTTALLRMLHERDSRRRFLSPKHFLMTDQVDLTGFISDVVTEEERRHELQDDEVDEVQELELEDVEVQENPEADEMLASMFGLRPPHAPRSHATRQAEKREQQRAQAMRRRQLQLLAPRLEILRNLPFFIPFEMRVQIFRGFILKDQIRRREGFVDPDVWRMHIAHGTQGRDVDGRPRGLDIISRHHAEIRRESVFDDAFDAYYSLGEALKEPIQISFIDRFGAPEAGIDGGGVTKEFLMSVTSEALDPNSEMPMFTENEQRYLYPNPVIFEETQEHLKKIGLKAKSESFDYNVRAFLRRYEFLGRIIGKCLYEGILIDVNFAGFFLLKWALTGGTTSASMETSYQASINDLKDFDEALYQGLLKLKNYTGDVESDFGLNFTVSDEIKVMDGNGDVVTKQVTNNLCPNGDKIAVTNTNKYVYIDRIVRYRLKHQPMAVTNAFLKGLGQIIQPMWLAMFNQKELQKLVGGDNTELDIADLRRNTQYGGLYVIGDDGLEHPTIELFWHVLKDMDDADRRKVLKFVTSTPRAPLLGFSHLNPKFSIRDSSEDQERLPSTSTCVNLLKLPRYGDVKTMKEKLLYAVNAGAGFDLS